MCVQLWRRYFCPKAPNFGPLESPGREQDHPLPKAGVNGHHLILEDENIFRENQEDPFDNVPQDRHIHWAHNLIRCAHRHSKHCSRADCFGMRIQYIDGACPYCTGDIDLHVENNDQVLVDYRYGPRVPGAGVQLDADVMKRFQVYKEQYLRQLLRLILRMLMKPVSMQSESMEWEEVMRVVWPETWCKLHKEHIGHSAHSCDCIPMKEEWSANLAFSMRKNEAQAILENLDRTTENSSPFWFYADLIYEQGADGHEQAVDWEPHERALALYERYPEKEDFPERQMAFVNLRPDEFTDRATRLLEMSRRCHDKLQTRGRNVSEKYPTSSNFAMRRLYWLGLGDWSVTLHRRRQFLVWVFRFIALDAGLDHNVMMYLGGALLAIMNPWPNYEINDHPSHPEPQALDSRLVAHDILQECMYWVEFHWPVDGNQSITDGFERSIRMSCYLIRTAERNKMIAMRDMTSRNRTADAKTQMYSTTSAVAIQEGSLICCLCRDEWDQNPCHEPVKLPCCNQYIGRRCLKSWLASKPIRGAEFGMAETAQTWATEFRCMLCRGWIGQHFSPNVNNGLQNGPFNIRGLNFHDDFRSTPQSAAWWDDHSMQLDP
ncbi:hypothetical protein EsH8_VI_000276 [Colletotrichum jinshuiense]